MTRQQHDACGRKAEQVTGGPSDEPWRGKNRRKRIKTSDPRGGGDGGGGAAQR